MGGLRRTRRIPGDMRRCADEGGASHRRCRPGPVRAVDMKATSDSSLHCRIAGDTSAAAHREERRLAAYHRTLASHPATVGSFLDEKSRLHADWERVTSERFGRTSSTRCFVVRAKSAQKKLRANWDSHPNDGRFGHLGPSSEPGARVLRLLRPHSVAFACPAVGAASPSAVETQVLAYLAGRHCARFNRGACYGSRETEWSGY